MRAPNGRHNDTVTNFNPETDKLDFEGIMTPTDFSNVNLSEAPVGSAIVEVNGNTIQLTGISQSQLGAGKIEFNQQNPALTHQIMAANS